MNYRTSSLYKLHSFLDAQLFYPLLLSSLLASGLFAGRVFLTGNFGYKNLVWNLFLAWIPYLFSLLAAALRVIYPHRGWLLLAPGFFWLIFFPNAPYIITDFQHLQD